MSEEEVINKLKSIKVCGDKGELWNYEAGILLSLIKRYEKMIDLMAEDMDNGIGYYTASKEEMKQLYRNKVESEE